MANIESDDNEITNSDDTDPELVGSWSTDAGNKLYLMARRGTAYASIWLDRDSEPVRIGRVKRAGVQVRSVEWVEPWSTQSAAWKDAQRAQAARALRLWGSSSV